MHIIFKSILPVVFYSSYSIRRILSFVFYPSYSIRRILFVVFYPSYFIRRILSVVFYPSYFIRRSILSVVFYTSYFIRRILYVVFYPSYFIRHFIRLILSVVIYPSYFIRRILSVVFYSSYFIRRILSAFATFISSFDLNFDSLTFVQCLLINICLIRHSLVCSFIHHEYLYTVIYSILATLDSIHTIHVLRQASFTYAKYILESICTVLPF